MLPSVAAVARVPYVARVLFDGAPVPLVVPAGLVAFVYPDGRGDWLDLPPSSLDSSLPFGPLPG